MGGGGCCWGCGLRMCGCVLLEGLETVSQGFCKLWLDGRWVWAGCGVDEGCT